MKNRFTMTITGKADNPSCCKCDDFPFPTDLGYEDFMTYLKYHPDYREGMREYIRHAPDFTPADDPTYEYIRNAPDLTHADNPWYYTRWKIEPLDFISANNLDFLRGNIIKYIMRYDRKGGAADLRKARKYLDRLIEDAENEKR